MQTQRDHVHAHQFQMARMSSALVLGDSTGADNPFQRPIVGLLVGIAVSVLVMAGFAVYGWLVPGGNTSWQAAGTIIVEKESGNRYVYVGGYLRPTRNLTSAMLIEGPGAAVKLVSRNSLKNVPHGPSIGLPDAPQVLPEPAALTGGPWLACVSASAGPGVRLDLDPAAPALPIGRDEFLLAAAGGRQYLLWRDQKHAVADPAVPVALGVTGADPVPAVQSWLDAMPTGDPIAIPAIPDAGKDGPKVAGHAYPIGQLFTQTSAGGGVQRFVLRKDGIAPVDRTAFTLLKAVGAQPVELSSAAIVGTPRSPDRTLTTYLPDLAGAVYRDPAGHSLCTRQMPAGPDTVRSMLVLAGRAYGPGTPKVIVPPGGGMVVFGVPLPKLHRIPDPYLITDEGIRYHVSGADTLPSLRLDGVPLVPFPAALLADIPSGPALSRAALTQNPEG